jgi:dihydropyrimidinase
MSGLAVAGGTVVTPAGPLEADVLVEAGQIAAVEPHGEHHGERLVLDATGCVVLPGAVDAHVHVGIPYVRLDGWVVTSADRFPDASRASALGGTTTIVDFAMQDVGEDLVGPLEERLEAIRESAVDVALHCWVMDTADEALAQVPELVSRGVPSFKAFMAYSQLGEPLGDGELFDLMAAVANAGGLLALHAENAGLKARRSEEARRSGRTGFEHFAASRPAVGEEEAVSRGLILARAAGAPVYFVHLSTGAAVRRLAAARAEGQAAFGETCPHFLHFDETSYLGPDAGDFLTAPPLRTPVDRETLWHAVVDGELDVVASDHTAWPRAVKSYGSGFLESIQGVAGLGLLLPLLAASAVEGRAGFGWEALARVTAEAPSRIFGLRPRKGAIEPGADADLVVLDPGAVAPVPAVPPGWIVDNGIYRGLPAVYPRDVLRRGERVVENGRYVGPERGGGEFVPGRLAGR